MSMRVTRRQSAMARRAPDSPQAHHGEDVADAADDTANNNGSVQPPAETAQEAVSENIFFFWPNIIGYIRIILAIASLYYMPVHPRTCSLLYSVSCLLDALDGQAARIFEQSTRFGAVLDMVTDRCATSCLLVFLSSAMPRWAIVFQSLIALDFSSHYIHMYATLVVGGANSSHKNVDKSQNWLMNLYYSNKVVLFVLCLLNELFFIALYLVSFSLPPFSMHIPLPGAEEPGKTSAGMSLDSSLLRQIFPDPFSAAALEIARANKMDPYWPGVIAKVSAPFMIIKQVINVVQLVQASKWLASVDVEMRRELGLPRTVGNKRL